MPEIDDPLRDIVDGEIKDEESEEGEEQSDMPTLQEECLPEEYKPPEESKLLETPYQKIINFAFSLSRASTPEPQEGEEQMEVVKQDWQLDWDGIPQLSPSPKPNNG